MPPTTDLPLAILALMAMGALIGLARLWAREAGFDDGESDHEF